MKPIGNPAAEFSMGALAFFAALSVEGWAALAVAAATVFTLLPLGLMRWRAFLRDNPPPRKPDSEEP